MKQIATIYYLLALSLISLGCSKDQSTVTPKPSVKSEDGSSSDACPLNTLDKSGTEVRLMPPLDLKRTVIDQINEAVAIFNRVHEYENLLVGDKTVVIYTSEGLADYAVPRFADFMSDSVKASKSAVLAYNQKAEALIKSSKENLEAALAKSSCAFEPNDFHALFADLGNQELSMRLTEESEEADPISSAEWDAKMLAEKNATKKKITDFLSCLGDVSFKSADSITSEYQEIFKAAAPQAACNDTY